MMTTNALELATEVTIIDGNRSYLTGRPVVVQVQDSYGIAIYVTRDGWVGVALEGEGTRIDEWQPTQVRVIG